MPEFKGLIKDIRDISDTIMLFESSRKFAREEIFELINELGLKKDELLKVANEILA